MKRRITVISMIAACVFISACTGGYETPEEGLQSISLSSGGSVDAVLRDDFSKENYDENELAEYINRQISEYNSAHSQNAVSLESHQKQDTQMVVGLHFASWGDYDAFMPDSLFTGTVQEAYDMGYDLNCALSYADMPEHVIGKNELMNMADKKIVIYEGKGSISLPRKIKYYTQGMKLTAADTAEASADGTYIIIY